MNEHWIHWNGIKNLFSSVRQNGQQLTYGISLCSSLTMSHCDNFASVIRTLWKFVKLYSIIGSNRSDSFRPKWFLQASTKYLMFWQHKNWNRQQSNELILFRSADPNYRMLTWAIWGFRLKSSPTLASRKLTKLHNNTPSRRVRAKTRISDSLAFALCSIGITLQRVNHLAASRHKPRIEYPLYCMRGMYTNARDTFKNSEFFHHNRNIASSSENVFANWISFVQCTVYQSIWQWID